MKRCLSIIIIAGSVALSGCATGIVKSKVTVFHEWPMDLADKSFVVERSQEQQNNLEHSSYENLVRNELERLGFRDATPAPAAKLTVAMDYSKSARDVRVVQPVVVDPFWYGPSVYGPSWRGRGVYGPYHDPFWYGPPIVEYRESQYQLFKRQLHITIAQVADGKKLFDVTVENEGRSDSLATIMPYMVRSAFADFPGKSGEARRVKLKMESDRP